MNDKNLQDYTTDEKLDVLLEGMANITLFLMSKYPDYVEQVQSIREKRNQEIVDDFAKKSVAEILKKLKGEE